VNTLEGYIERLVGGNKRVKVKAKPVQAAAESVQETEEKTENSSVQEKPAHTKRRGSTMDIISEAEDNLDDIIYSTRTIDINEVLKLEEEKKKQQRKAGKNNEK
ncbi:MAG: hypothetical protein J6C04_08965, partial [Oscillospiraceae bacterium]|nr:hypothetical protein [Oscillospiraceae bacterium]